MAKNYCVHVYPRCREYENISAESPEQAEAIVRENQYGNDFDAIHAVEVMRQCECGMENDTANNKCEGCGKEL